MWPFERFRLEPDMSLRSLRSIIAGQPPAVAEKTATVLEAAILMKEKSKGALLVVDGTRLTGIFTERDALFRVIAAGRDAATTTLADVMTPQPQTMHPDEPFLKALRLMHKRGFRHLPVVENGRPLGVVSARDALDDDLYELRVEMAQREDERD
jgi:CBS domain-containing protein